MNCQDFTDYLNDAIDGALPEEIRESYNAHLESCDSCRQEERLMRELLTDVSKLPSSILPERDLWAGIESQIQKTPENVTPFKIVRSRIIQTTLAAAVVLIVFIAISAPIQPADDQVTKDEPSTQDLEREQLEADYALARSSLKSALDDRKDDLSPEMLATIEENLNIIENAVVDINRALATSPQDPQLERMLQAAYQSEVTLLQHAVQMNNDDS